MGQTRSLLSVFNMDMGSHVKTRGVVEENVKHEQQEEEEKRGVGGITGTRIM